MELTSRIKDDILDVRDYVLSRGYSDDRLMYEYKKRCGEYEEAVYSGKSFSAVAVFVKKEGYRLACVERGIMKDED